MALANRTTAPGLYGRATDKDIAAVPRSISDASTAVFFGVPVERVREIREATERTPKAPSYAAGEPVIGAIVDRDAAHVGSRNLLRAQLRTGQHQWTCPKAVDTIKAWARAV